MNKVGSKCHLQYSTVDIQDLDSSACGWFCICAIVYDSMKKKKEFDYAGFLSNFNDNTTHNDLLLKRLLTKLKVL